MTGQSRAGAFVALTCLVLALAAFVTATSDGALWSWDDKVVSETDQVRDCSREDCEPGGGPGTDRRLPEPPAWVGMLGDVLVAGIVGFLIVLLARRIRFVRRVRFAGVRVESRHPPEGHDDDDAVDREALADELAERLVALEGGRPRNAIVAAWIALEEAAARAGVPRDETETPTEFTRRAMAAYHLDEDALGRLADLYREARFSQHQVTEHHIRHARDCLGILSRDLRRAVPGNTGSAP